MKSIKSFLPLTVVTFLFFACQGNNESSLQSENNLSNDHSLKVEEIQEDQEGTIEEDWLNDSKENIISFIEAVMENDAETAANYIAYPLKRQEPIPSISNKMEFLTPFVEIFDDSIKNKLNEHLRNPDYIDLSQSNGTLGILNGYF